MILSISGKELGVIIVLAIIIVLAGLFFTRMYLKQKAEIKKLEEQAEARKIARSQRRRK